MKKITVLILSIFVGFSVTFSQSLSNALDFDGMDDYVAIPSGTALFSNLQGFSMCGWVYPTNANANWPDFDGYFGIKAEFVCDFYIAQINGTGLEARITTTDGTFTINPSELSQVTLNEWQHFALVYDSTELKLYLNGVFDGSVSATGSIIVNNLELTIGMLDFETTDFFLDGKVDEVTCWSKALTEEEVSEYMCISGDPSSFTDLTAYYNFNEEEGLVLPDYFGNYDGILTNMTGNEWIESEVCYSGYDITFIVTEEDGTTPIEEAEVDLEGIVKTTDENGEVVFSNYDPGTYVYEITKADYYPSSGSVEVIDLNVTENVQLAPIVYYDITFIITEDPGGAPLDSALINLDGIIQYTNEDGETTFTGYLPGTYQYFISKDNYNLATGNAEVIDENVTVEIVLILDAIQNLTDRDFKIYPNPGKGLINLSFDIIPDKIEIFNAFGVKLMDSKINQEEVVVDIQDFPNGIYIINLISRGEIYTQKLIKNR